MNKTLRPPSTKVYRLFIADVARAIRAPDKSDPLSLLNGRAGQSCIELLPPETLRSLGAFFTPSTMAARVAALSDFDAETSVVLDPACGAGDLLLPFASKLPIRKTASSTMDLWNERLLGCDLSDEFVRAARLRLVLLAITRGVELDRAPVALADRLSNIAIGDGLSAATPYTSATHIVMNPPFGAVDAPEDTEWRRGNVTAAALFVDRALRLCKPETRLIAILPEVLRTGTSYRQWRDFVSFRSMSNRTESLGLFSADADVDVFLKLVTVRATVPKRPKRRQISHGKSLSVGDKFAVTVGPVVPHRHDSVGPSCAFLHAGNATAWKHIKRINERRGFEGKLLTPPFVVIRRTSRPGDRCRAIASLVLGSRPVAVENHLLVARPCRGGVPICKKLLRLLRSKVVNRALDRTMRCRHLTTESVSQLDWFS